MSQYGGFTRYSDLSSRGGSYVIPNDQWRTFNLKEYGNSAIIPEHSLMSGFINRKPIKFSKTLALSTRDFVMSKIDEDLRYVKVPKLLENIFGSELKRFLCSLEAYRRSPNPVIPIEHLVDIIQYKNSAAGLKKIRDKSFRITVNSNPFELPDDYENIPYYIIKDIGDIFNYNYWIFWEEDDVDDLEYSFIPVKPIEEDDKVRFKNKLNSLLPDFVPEVDEKEVLLSTSGSTCYDKGCNFVYEAKERKNSFSSEPLHGRRSIIRIGPENTRDAIVLPVAQSNTVKLLEKQISLIASRMKGSAYVRNEEEFNERIKDFYEKNEYFADRDITKEGLTKPRELIKLVFEVLKEVYPHIKCFKYSGIYDSFYIDIGAEKGIRTHRGHGLGMANAITTMIQIVIFELSKDELILQLGDVGRKCSCIAFNDDFTAGFFEEYLANDYWDIEDSVMERYRLLRKNTKSYLSRKSFSFCERYFPESFNRKVSYRLNEVFSVFSLPVISLAKIYFNSLSRYELPVDQNLILKEIVSYFGYEFFHDEYKVPFAFGGWVTPVYNDVDLSFAMIDDITDEMERAFFSCKEKLDLFFGKQGKGRIYYSPLESIYATTDLVIPDEFNIFLNYRIPFNKVKSRYDIRNNDDALNRALSKFYLLRKEIYKDQKAFGYNKSELYLKYCKNNPQKDVLPPLSMIVWKRFTYEDSQDYVHPEVPNPILSMVKYFNNSKIEDKYIPVILNLDKRVYNKQKILDSHIRTSDIFSDNENSTIVNDRVFTNINIEGGNSSFYINPLSLVNASIAVYKKLGYPEVSSRTENLTFFENDERIMYYLSSNTYSEIFHSLTSKIGYRKALDALELSKIVGLDVFISIVFPKKEEDIPPDKPTEDDSEGSSSEDSEAEDSRYTRKYKLNEYDKWEEDGFPVTRDIAFENLRIFNTISTIRQQHLYYSDYQSVGGLQTPRNLIDLVEKNRGLIILTGGNISYPNENYVYISYPSIDEGDTSSSDESQEIDLFDF